MSKQQPYVVLLNEVVESMLANDFDVMKGICRGTSDLNDAMQLPTKAYAKKVALAAAILCDNYTDIRGYTWELKCASAAQYEPVWAITLEERRPWRMRINDAMMREPVNPGFAPKGVVSAMCAICHTTHPIMSACPTLLGPVKF